MKLKLISLAALAVVSGAAFADATLDVPQYTLAYDNTTSFGALSGWFGDGTTFGFNWNVPTSVSAVSTGSLVEKTFALPSFVLVAKPGYAISGPVTAFLGNLTFTETGVAQTWVTGTGKVGFVGGPLNTVSGTLDRTVTSSGPGFAIGFHSGTMTSAAIPVPSLVLTNASITLHADGAGSFASITGQPQNQLRLSFNVSQVPEPETYAMLLAGLGIVGFMARRRVG